MVELLYYFTLLSKYYDLLLSNDMTKWTHTFPEVFGLCYVFTITVFVNHSMSIPKLNQCLAPCCYGNHILKIIRRYQKLEYCVKKLGLDIKFLNTCQNNDLCRTFIQYKISLTRLQNSGAYRQSERLFIQEDYFRNRKY